jgi:hypothetical protein
LFKSNEAQTKLFRLARVPAATGALLVCSPGDSEEREADRIARAVMLMPIPESGPTITPPANPPVIQAKCAACEEEELQRAGAGEAPASVPGIALDVLRAPGQPLDEQTRAFFELRFGADFSTIRVHTDAHAARAAEAVQAQAYTLGNSIVFNSGEFSPYQEAGRHLLAHELTHTIQQGAVEVGGLGTPTPQESAVRGGLLQRQDDPNQSVSTETLDSQYRAALVAYDWRLAAEKLNGFSRDDILARLAELTRDQIDNLHQGALDNPNVGSGSQVAQATGGGTRLNPRDHLALGGVSCRGPGRDR